MNKKTLKATASIAICCVLMIVVVIYTPKPTPESTKRRETFEETQRLEELLQRGEKEHISFKLLLEAIGQAHEAVGAIVDVHELIHREKADLKPLIEANIKAIAALTEAGEAVKSGTEEIQRLNEENIDLKPLIEASIELIEALTEMVERMKALTEELQRFTEKLQRLNEKKVRPWPPHEAIYEAVDKALNPITLALNAYRKASNALRQYQDTRRQH